MNNLKLFSISLLVIVTLAGIPHLFAFYANPSTSPLPEYSQETLVVMDTTPELASPSPSQPEAPSLKGTWESALNYDEFTGTMITQIEEYEGQLVGYVVAYRDEQGYSEEASDLILAIEPGEGPHWLATYYLSYEGEEYDVPCKIRLLGPGRLELSYDYYGFSGTETWTQQ